jgi:Replication initiator protein A
MTYKSDNCKTWGDLVALSHEGDLQKMMRLCYERDGITHDLRDNNPLADISIKDELCLMDIAPFTLAKKADLKNLVLEYKLKDAKVTISGLPERGIATVYDYDIVLYMVSHLAKEMNKVKKIIQNVEEQRKANPKSKVYANPQLPSRFFEPNIETLLGFCGRPLGGLQYDAIHKSLLRLQGTSIAIEKFTADGYRRAGAFSYINDFQIIDKTDRGTIQKVRIGIPNWIYDGIVRIGTPTVLSMNRQYFDLSEGIQRFLHRYVTKNAGFGGTLKVSVRELHEKSGSKNTLPFFTRDLKNSIKKLKERSIQEFSIIYLSEGRGKNFVLFKKRDREITLDNQIKACPIELNEDLKIKAEEIAPSYDSKWLFDSWIKWTTKKMGWKKVKSPEKAFLAFCKTNYERNPNP